MYAAAGGASLASRQARQRQRQQKKTQQLQAKLHPTKQSLTGAGTGSGAGTGTGTGVVVTEDHGTATPTRQSRQFHQLPTNYLRTPQAQIRKLSSGFTTQSKLLLPIDEGDTQSVLNMRMHSHAHLDHTASLIASSQDYHHPLPHHHHHQHSHFHSHHHKQPQQHQTQPQLISRYTTPIGGVQQLQQAARNAPKTTLEHRGNNFSIHQQHLQHYFGANTAVPYPPHLHHHPSQHHYHRLHYHLEGATPMTKSATATIPLVRVHQQERSEEKPALAEVEKQEHLVHDQTAAEELDDLPAGEDVKQDFDIDLMDEKVVGSNGTIAHLGRKCSVYRMKRVKNMSLPKEDHETVSESLINDGVDLVKRTAQQLPAYCGVSQQHQQYERLVSSGEDDPVVLRRSGQSHQVQICAYCEEGICTCEHLEHELEFEKCAQGRAAWLERSRRCSVQDTQQNRTHQQWLKKNRVHDASLTSSSDDEDILGMLRGPSTFANAVLYIGLGTIALGLVIAFVGTGEKGFKTVELRLIGPSLIGLGFVCCLLRILFCICPSHCISTSRKSISKSKKVAGIQAGLADHTTALLHGECKRVSIASNFGPQNRCSTFPYKSTNNKRLNESVEALRHIATTSLFMQNERKSSISLSNRIVPIIKEPDIPTNADASTLELKIIDSNGKSKEMLPLTAISTINENNSNTNASDGHHDKEELAMDPSKPSEEQQYQQLEIGQAVTGGLIIREQNKILSLPLNSTVSKNNRIELVLTKTKEGSPLSFVDVQGGSFTDATHNRTVSKTPMQLLAFNEIPTTTPTNTITDKALTSSRAYNVIANDYIIRGHCGLLTIPQGTSKQQQGASLSIKLPLPAPILASNDLIKQPQSIPGQVLNLSQEKTLNDNECYSDLTAIHNIDPSKCSNLEQLEGNLKKSTKCETELLLSPAKLGQ